MNRESVIKYSDTSPHREQPKRNTPRQTNPVITPPHPKTCRKRIFSRNVLHFANHKATVTGPSESAFTVPEPAAAEDHFLSAYLEQQHLANHIRAWFADDNSSTHNCVADW